jgi:thiol peroxidase
MNKSFGLITVLFIGVNCFVPLCQAQENCAPAQERVGVATMKGKPIVLLGPEVKVGQKAPDFMVQADDLSDARLSDFSGKIKLIASVPSLDTRVCDLEIRHFNQEASAMSPDIKILFISMDLPFAQKRFCSAADIKNVQALSDHRTADFGTNYGVLIKDLRLLARAIFIIDKNNTVRYVQYVKEEGTQPDYEAALKALKNLL